jgi:hypothetical protein
MNVNMALGGTLKGKIYLQVNLIRCLYAFSKLLVKSLNVKLTWHLPFIHQCFTYPRGSFPSLKDRFETRLMI